MNYLGIEASVRNLPELDRDFFPLYKFNHAFLASAQKPVGVAVERSGGEMASVHTFIHGTPDRIEADRYYIRRLVKSMLWMKGGWRVYISGDITILLDRNSTKVYDIVVIRDGEKVRIESISSPKNSIRQGASCAGLKISTIPPRRANSPATETSYSSS